jgi:hypothetical protein
MRQVRFRPDSLRQTQVRARVRARPDSLRRTRVRARVRVRPDSLRGTRVRARVRVRPDSLRGNQVKFLRQPRLDSLRQVQVKARADSLRRAHRNRKHPLRGGPIFLAILCREAYSTVPIWGQSMAGHGPVLATAAAAGTRISIHPVHLPGHAL